MSKEDDIKFIKDFIDISIIDICKELKVDKANLYRGNASADKTHQVRVELEKRIKNIIN